MVQLVESDHKILRTLCPWALTEGLESFLIEWLQVERQVPEHESMIGSVTQDHVWRDISWTSSVLSHLKLSRPDTTPMKQSVSTSRRWISDSLLGSKAQSQHWHRKYISMNCQTGMHLPNFPVTWRQRLLQCKCEMGSQTVAQRRYDGGCECKPNS